MIYTSVAAKDRGLPAFETRYDHLPTEALHREVFSWLGQQDPAHQPKDDITEAFNNFQPRTVFLKNLPHQAAVLDLGAGDGSLSIFKNWLHPPRPDLRLYALSLEKGERFDDYAAYELKNFEKEPVFPDIQFDGIVCAHFIEHLHAPERAITFAAERLRSGGHIYIEWPHPISARMPARDEIMKAGIQISTTNFYDDHTHIEPWAFNDVAEMLTGAGFTIGSGGRIMRDYVADEMLRHGRALNDMVLTTLGFWAKFGWAQYLVATRDART